MDRSRIALIIPALNEASSVGGVVTRSLAYGIPVVIDDASSDGTGEIAAAAGAQVVRHERNSGYDGALNSGFRHAAAAGFEWAITLDADGQHDPRTLEKFIDALAQGADVVIGIRDRQQRFAERVYAAYARIAWRIRDPLCGLKGYRLAVYRNHGCFDSCASIGTELAICAAAAGYHIRQVPVPTRDRNGTPRFSTGLKANWRILRALWVVRSKARALPQSGSALHDRRNG
jgi:glycosyltransferase involved in cell wall biosynthesis